MSDHRTLIRDACVITMDPALGTLERADVLIEGERIRAVAPDLGAEDCEVIDGTAMIAIPGLVDIHRHLFFTPLRGLGADYTSFETLVEAMVGFLPLFRAEDVYIGVYAGALEALESGVTTVVDHADCINAPGHADEMIRAHEESRIRSVFLYGAGKPQFNPGEPFDPALFFELPEWHFANMRRVRETLLPKDDGRIRFGTTLHAAEGSTVEKARREIEFGRELGAHLIGCNAGLAPMSGKAPTYIVDLANAGLLGPDMLIIHGNSLTDEDIDRIAEAGAGIAAEPEYELMSGTGFPIIGRALARGAQTSVGVDGVPCCRGDLFTQLRLALQAERHRCAEPLLEKGLLFRTTPITAQEGLDLITLGAARAANLDAEIGSLTPGKQADVTLIRTDTLGLAPVTDPVKTVVSQANAADVDTVFLAGEPVKRDGELLGVDIPRTLDQLAASRDYLVEELGKYDNKAIRDLTEAVLPLE